MEPRGIHHLGVAVTDLDEAVATYERLLGAELEHRELVPDQGVEAASLRVGAGRVELLASLGEETPVGKFIAKRGPGMHHLAYEVDDVASVLAETAITTTLAYVGGMKATPDANHRWLTWSKSTRGSEKLYPVGTLKNRLRSNRFSR